MDAKKEEVAAGRVRRMRADERGQLRRVMRTCFGWFASLFFDTGKAAFVYDLDGQIAGGITLSSFPIDAERTGGIVKWLFVLPQARGRGAASALLEHALAWFAEEVCTDLFSCVEGHNTNSSNRFARTGFRILSFCQQVRLYGIRLPLVWFRTFHLTDVGLFLWSRHQDDALDPAKQPQVSPSLRHTLHRSIAGMAGTTLILVLAGLLMAWRQGQAVTLTTLWHLVVVAVGLMGARMGAMVLTARWYPLPVLYRPWETGLLLTVLVPLLSGGVFVAPGGMYPLSRVWSYREWLPKLGPVAVAGAGALLLAGWGLQTVRWVLSPGASGPLVDLALFYVRAVVLFDVVFVFFPFEGFNGRRILNWRADVWAAVAAATVALWVFGYAF